MIYKCILKMQSIDVFKQGGNDLLTEVKKSLIRDMQQTDYLNGLYTWGVKTDDFDEYSRNYTEALNKAVEIDINNYEGDSKFFNAVTLDEGSLSANSEMCRGSIIEFSIEVNINLEKLFNLYNIGER